MYDDCEECGSTSISEVTREGVRVMQCDLCGALSGDDRAVARVMLVEEAWTTGHDPAIYPLVRQLNRLDGVTVLRSEVGDESLRTWPCVQMAVGRLADRPLENLAKSLALSNAGSEIHWVLEVEYQNQLVVTLKPRFHRDVADIHGEILALARADLDRIGRNLERDMRLSWWRT